MCICARLCVCVYTNVHIYVFKIYSVRIHVHVHCHVHVHVHVHACASTWTCILNLACDIVHVTPVHCRYGLELIQVSGSIRHALSTLKETHPQLKAVCMGTRYTDPYSGDLTPFSPTDSGWPSYVRVNCILVSINRCT